MGAAASVAPLPSRAEAQPTLPRHDVTITYRLDGALRDAAPGGLPATVRLLWDAGRQRLRLEPQGRAQALLVDLSPPRAELIETGLRSVIDLPVRPKDLDPLLLRDAQLTRRGSATIAGLACIDYAVASRRGKGTVCLTADGVALRAAGAVDGRSGRLTAVSVTAGPIPAALFEPPQGYFRLTLPGLRRLQ